MVYRTICLVPLVSLIACPERVTGEAKPLDPKFYADVEDIRGDPNGGGGASRPFASHKGESITLKGMIVSEMDDFGIDIDFRTPDPSAEGGMKGHGKLLLETPGEFSLQLPKNLGELNIQAFQDLESDGPSMNDPFAQTDLTVKDEDVVGIELNLKVGTRQDKPQGGNDPSNKAPPEHKHVVQAPGGVEPPPHPGGSQHQNIGPSNIDPFADHKGPRVTIRGKLLCDGCGRIDLDFFQPVKDGPGGRKMLGKMKFPAGEYKIEIPKNFGPVILEAFVDINNDGPNKGDWMGSYSKNPLVVQGRDIGNIDIELSIPEDGKMPRQEVQVEK